jgi:flavin-dependent dehydrogenase
MNDSTHEDYDLIVAGLGIAGSMAAVAAGRLGLRVLAFDYGAFPGGVLTSSGTGPMMTFHAGELQSSGA